MAIYFSITISIASLERFCRRKSISAACHSSGFGDFEIILFALADSSNNCYHLPESGHYAEKYDDDKKGYCVEQYSKNINSNQLNINRQL